eukprot:scaffold59838_cov73-Phaeocystis_antarctica.AAC.2
MTATHGSCSVRGLQQHAVCSIAVREPQRIRIVALKVRLAPNTAKSDGSMYHTTHSAFTTVQASAASSQKKADLRMVPLAPRRTTSQVAYVWYASTSMELMKTIQISAKCAVAFHVLPMRHMPSSSKAAPCLWRHPHTPLPLHHRSLIALVQSLFV